MMKRNQRRYVVATVFLFSLAVAGLYAATTFALEPRIPMLYATVGSGSTIKLSKTSTGGRLKSIKAGTYNVRVRDRSDMHNFHLYGGRVNRASGLEAKGTTTWRVRFRVRTYNYKCDAHPTTMKGSFRST